MFPSAGQKHSSYCNWYLRLTKPAARTNWTIPCNKFLLTRSCVVAIILACFQDGLREKSFLQFCNEIENQTENEH